VGILGMQPCEGTEAVPPNARSHTVGGGGVEGSGAVGFRNADVAANLGSVMHHRSLRLLIIIDPPNPNRRRNRPPQVLLSGAFPGDRRALVRLLLGMDASGSVAMKVVSRAEDEALSEAVHAIIQEA